MLLATNKSLKFPMQLNWYTRFTSTDTYLQRIPFDYQRAVIFSSQRIKLKMCFGTITYLKQQAM